MHSYRQWKNREKRTEGKWKTHNRQAEGRRKAAGRTGEENEQKRSEKRDNGESNKETRKTELRTEDQNILYGTTTTMTITTTGCRNVGRRRCYVIFSKFK